MVNPKHEHASRQNIEVELTESDLKLLGKVQQCYAAGGPEPSAEEALRIGLRELADRCRPHGINKERRNWEMTLTKAQVVEYANTYKKQGSNFRGLNGDMADKRISKRLEGADEIGLDDLREVPGGRQASG